MYNYDFKNESINYEKNNVFAKVNKNELFVNVLVTNKNLLIFYNAESDFITQKSRGVFITPIYELIIKLDLNNINYEISENNTYINEEEIVLYDFILNKEV